MSTVHKNSTTIFVEDIVERIKKGRMILDPFWQRGNVWDLKKQQYLIDSILKDLHVPELLFCINHDGNSESIDGKQRCTTLFDFLHDKFPYNGKKFSEMTQQAKTKINTYQLAVSTYEGLANTQKVEMFRRIQGGAPLKPGEIINSMKQEFEISRYLFDQIVTNENYIALKNALHIDNNSDIYKRNEWVIWLTSLFANSIAMMEKNTFDADDSLRKGAMKHCSKSIQSLVSFIENYSEHVQVIHWQKFEEKLVILKDIIINVDTTQHTLDFFKCYKGLTTILPIFHSICVEKDEKAQLIEKWKCFFKILKIDTKTLDNDDQTSQKVPESSPMSTEDDEFAKHYDDDGPPASSHDASAGPMHSEDSRSDSSDSYESLQNEWKLLRRKNISPSTIKKMHSLFIKYVDHL